MKLLSQCRRITMISSHPTTHAQKQTPSQIILDSSQHSGRSSCWGGVLVSARRRVIVNSAVTGPVTDATSNSKMRNVTADPRGWSWTYHSTCRPLWFCFLVHASVKIRDTGSPNAPLNHLYIFWYEGISWERPGVIRGMCFSQPCST